LVERFLAGGFHRVEPVAENGGQDRDHLPIAVMGYLQPASHPLHCRWQHPVLEWRAVA
jgi:hypothetical protein